MKKFQSIKFPKWRDHFKVFFHCLFFFHQQWTYSERKPGKLFFKDLQIGCATCNPNEVQDIKVWWDK